MEQEKIKLPLPTDEAMKIAEAIYQLLTVLKHPSGWNHHPQEFLPADVCCDFVGNLNFKKSIARVLDKEIKNMSHQ